MPEITETAEPVNYLDALAGDIGLLVPDCPLELLRLYALLALTAGTGTTLENVHDAWAAWRAATKPGHPSLIPFGELSAEVQELDAPYRDAIRRVASPVEIDDAASVPPLPDGEFGRIELPGYRNHTGWITEETRFGVQVAAVRDWDGRKVAEVVVGPGCQLVHLPTPLKRPDAGPVLRSALPPGRGGFDPEHEFGDGEDPGDDDTEGLAF